MNDLKFAFRQLLKNPGFTAVAVLTLALGIGATTAIFSVVNTVLLRPLPYSQADRLVFLYNSAPGFGVSKLGLMEEEYLRLRDQAQSLKQVSLYTSTTLTLTGKAEPERLRCGTATGNLFAALGVPLALGRSFEPEEELRGRDNVVILSHDFWARKFSADPEVLGQTLTLDERGCTIVGVLPPGFRSPLEFKSDQRIELWVPPGFASPCCSHDFNVVARLREERTLEQARADLGVVMAAVRRDYPQGWPKDGAKEALIKPLQQEIVGDTRRALWVLLAAVALVLLIASANVANLLLARSEGRQKEIAIRAALGAGRARILRQLIAESLLLAMTGGGLGLLLAWWGCAAMLPLLGGESIPRLGEIAPDARVLGFALSISFLTAGIFGLAPALQAVKVDLQSALKDGGRTSAAPRGRSRLRPALVVTEVALSLTLLVGAGLLIKSFGQLRQVDTGFHSENLLTLRLFPPASAYTNDQRVGALYEDLLGRVRSLPGVKDAAVADGVPFGDTGGGVTVMQVEGQPEVPPPLNSAGWSVVSPEYFRTLGVRLVRGRFLEPADREQTLPVAVVNETLARAHWPNENPVGRRIRLLNDSAERATTAFLTVVGVVADVKNDGLTEAARQEAYLPLRQRAVAIAGMGRARQLSLVVRTSAGPMNLLNAIRQEVWAVDRSIPVTGERTMEQLLAAVTGQPRFNMILLGIFAALALALAAIGLYGVIACDVAQRTPEFGIRMSLGATRRDVLRLVLRRGVKLIGLGLVIGIAGALGLAQLIATMLYGVKPTDAATFIVVSLTLLLVALFASWLPARRAARVDPMEALRSE